MDDNQKRHDDVAYFIAFCIELYKNAKGMAGGDVARLFTETDLTDFLVANFDSIHSQSPQWILEEINEYLSINR